MLTTKRLLAFLCSLLSGVLAAFARDGLSGAREEVKAQARALRSLAHALTSPLVFGELRRLTSEAEGLRAAWLTGETVLSYVTRRCKEVGEPLGSPTYHAFAEWAGVMYAEWEPDETRVSALAELAEPDESAPLEWDDYISG
jgi:hypothetical protein